MKALKKLTLQDVQDYLAMNDTNNECVLLSTEYVSAKDPLKFHCNICQRDFTRAFSALKRPGARFCCSVCARGRSLTIQDVREFLKENDINHECELLSEYYQNYHTPLEFKCNICGEKFTRTMSQVQQKIFKCTKCCKKTQNHHNLTLKDIKQFIADNDIENSCELLSIDYANNSTPLLFKCNVCGENFLRTFATMKAKKAFKCFRCAHNLPNIDTVSRYNTLKSYFRGKTYLWKKNFLSNHTQCDITGEEKELDVHHLINFATILNQAAENVEIPLTFYPDEFEKNGYNLERLTQEFLRLHDKAPAVLLSAPIHQLFHKEYGYKNNTPEQYYEFKEKYLKGEYNL